MAEQILTTKQSRSYVTRPEHVEMKLRTSMLCKPYSAKYVAVQHGRMRVSPGCDTETYIIIQMATAQRVNIKQQRSTA